MELQQLRYLVSLCHSKSFTKVAEELFVSQSAVSQQIKKMEQELGVRLFSRSTHGMTPTDAGEELCRYAQAVLDAYQQLIDASQRLSGQAETAIRIFSLGKLKVVGLPKALVEFHALNPEITLEFTNPSDTAKETALSRNDWDIAILREANCAPYRDSPNFCCEQLLADPGVLLVSQDSAFSAKESVSLNELQGLELLFGNKGGDTYHLIQGICSEIDPPVQISKIFTDDYDILADLIQNGEAGAIGCQSFGRYYGLRSIPLLPPVYNNLVMVSPAEKKNFPALKKLRTFLTDYFQAAGPESE